LIWAYSPLIKIFFPFTKAEGKKKKEIPESYGWLIAPGHDGRLRRAVCIKANHKRSEKEGRGVIRIVGSAGRVL
jgi:hypothetical protein